MSVKIMTEVFELDLPKPSLKLILLGLADCANNEGECYPSINTLAKKCSLGVDTVYRGIKKLEQMGLLVRKNRAHSNGRCASNFYIIYPQGPSQTARGTLAECQGDPSKLLGGTLANCYPSKENRNIEPSNKQLMSGKPDVAQNLLKEFEEEVRQGITKERVEELEASKPLKTKAVFILAYLNFVQDAKYQAVPANLKLIEARLKEGHTLMEVIGVIHQRRRAWKTNAEMMSYLRPKTLFNATNFANYVGQL